MQPGAIPTLVPTTHSQTTFSRKTRLPRVVAVGGGTGLPVVLRGLADAFELLLGRRDLNHLAADALTAVVTVTDDGGSSGRLRRDMGVLPPGDFRNCLAALSSSAAFERLLQHRFEARTDLDGHALGNLMLAALTQMTGSFGAAVAEMAKLLRARGHVYPSTIEDVTLRAELSTGEIVEGETAIVAHPARIHRLTLARPVQLFPDTLRALINADVILIGPGSLYTSVLPNLLVGGMAATFSAVGGVRIYIANLMTQPGETDNMSLDDHLRVLREHTGGRDLFDYVLVNRTTPTSTQLKSYRCEGAELVKWDSYHLPSAPGAQIAEADLLDTNADHVRHDSRKLANAVLAIARREHPALPQGATSARDHAWQTKFTQTAMGGNAGPLTYR